MNNELYAPNSLLPTHDSLLTIHFHLNLEQDLIIILKIINKIRCAIK